MMFTVMFTKHIPRKYIWVLNPDNFHSQPELGFYVKVGNISLIFVVRELSCKEAISVRDRPKVHIVVY